MRSDRLKALNVPHAVEVETGASGAPLRIRARGRRKKTEWRSIENIGETWRLDDEWWRRPIARRYVEVIVEGGGRMVLFEDLVTGEWFAQ